MRSRMPGERAGGTEWIEGTGMSDGTAEAGSVASIRNVVLVGPSGAGKTTLAERLLQAAGAVKRPGAVDSAGSVPGSDAPARLQRGSVSLSVASFPFGDAHITLLDTPGHGDFLGQVRAGLRGADAALFVVSSVDGIDAATRSLWDECESVSLPRAVIVTHLDLDDSDFDETVAVCHRMLTGGRAVLPVHLPVLDDDEVFAGVLDLVTSRIHEWTSAEEQVRDADPEHLGMTADARMDLLEGIIAESEDQTLMDRFIAGDDLPPEQLIEDLARAIARGHFHPVYAFSGASGIGAALVLELIAQAFPSPLERPLPTITTLAGQPTAPLTADPDGPLCAEVIQTTTDPQLGRESVVRVFSGRLPAEAPLHISGHFHERADLHDHDLTEWDATVSLMLGTARLPVRSAIAGSIVAVTGLGSAETGDTLSFRRQPLLMEPWRMPEPQLPVAITPASTADEARLRDALARLVAEDPTLRTEVSDGQLVLWCLGDAHAELAIDRLREQHGIETSHEQLRTRLRETFTVPAPGDSRNASGTDADARAHCTVLVEPGEPGSGVEVNDATDARAIPHEHRTAVERGIRQQLTRGGLAGYPLTDVRVTIQALESQGQAAETCVTAGALAVRDALDHGELCLLEPLSALTVLVPSDFADAITSDLASRRGRVTAIEADDDGQMRISALVPEQELARYAIDVHAIAHGTAAHSRHPAGFTRMPRQTTRSLLPMAD